MTYRPICSLLACVAIGTKLWLHIVEAMRHIHIYTVFLFSHWHMTAAHAVLVCLPVCGRQWQRSVEFILCSV
jgi:hypothetical protein